MRMLYPIITAQEARQILAARPGILELSLDLGMSKCRVERTDTSIIINGISLPLTELSQVKGDACYRVVSSALERLALFSPETNLYYALVATRDWPTIKLSSTPMHRHISLSPRESAGRMLKELSPMRGIVLDSCCGLGYTAILAARQAARVYTFERDEAVLALARCNPHSQELFRNPRITLAHQDVSEGIRAFKDATVDRVLHDPPTFAYAPELYHAAFYAELFRVMKPKSILYHYAPSPHKRRGVQFYPKIIRLLRDAGFCGVDFHPASSGVVAHTP